MKKEEIKSINLIRAVCALGIIAYHFSCHLLYTDFKPFFTYVNGNWGYVFVSIFFLVSGYVLYYNYPDSINVISFYKKRWKSIFPMFYLAYFSFEIGHIMNSGNLFFRGNPLRYVFTLIGMDGYLNMVTQTHYNLGEWFLGAIIILYVLYPVILYCFNKNDKITYLVIVMFYIFFARQTWIAPITHWSMASCLLCFVVGMMFMKYRSLLMNRFVVIFCMTGALVLCFVSVPINSQTCNHLFGMLLYCVMMVVGEKLLENKLLYNVTSEISKLTYAVFLIHHIVIIRVLNAWRIDSAKKVVVMLGSLTLLILFEAKMLNVVVDYIMGKFHRNKKEFVPR